MRIRAAVLGLCLLASGQIFAGERSGTADKSSLANQAYFDGKYADAEALYGQALDNCAADCPPVLLYNLGNAWYQLGSYGKAVYYYKLAAAAGGAEVRSRAESNLDAARRALLARYKEKLEKGILRYDENHGVWYSLFTVVGSGVSLTLFVIFALPLLASLFAWTFLRSDVRRLVARMAFLSLLIPALASGMLYFGRAAVEDAYTLGIIASDDAMLLDAPDLAAPSSPLPEGQEVRILLHNEVGFFKIQLSGGRTGYVPDDRVLPFPDHYRS